MTADKEYIQQISRYLSGEADRIDKKNLEHWLKSNPKNQIVFEEIQNIWFALNANEEKKIFETEKAWEKYSRWIDKENKQTSIKKSNRYVRIVSQFAAAIIVSVLITIAFTHYANQSTEQVYTANIPIGQKGSITLTDGTIVQLNGGSQLVCQTFEGKDERRVSLNGEAYFHVAHNDDQAFIVDVNNITVKVYGTEFNIHGYSEDNITKTALIKGSVGVKLDNGDEYLLKPNELIAVSRNGDVSLLQNQQYNNTISWLNDKYKFKDERLIVISRQIERMYGVKIIISDPKIGEELYTGQFSRNESIESVLLRLIMSSPFKLDYTLTNKEITIYKK